MMRENDIEGAHYARSQRECNRQRSDHDEREEVKQHNNHNTRAGKHALRQMFGQRNCCKEVP
ncbi:MAG: hypothetical protein ACXWPI_05075 [Ktedonobacterales bacterium]